MASPVLQDLYHLLEVTFNPLQLCSKVEDIIKLLQDSDQYITPLRDVTLVTLIRQIAQVYESITYSRLLQLSHFGTQFQIERLLVECVRQNDMQVNYKNNHEYFLDERNYNLVCTYFYPHTVISLFAL